MGKMPAIKRRVHFAGSNLAFKQYAKVGLLRTKRLLCCWEWMRDAVITLSAWWRQNEKRGREGKSSSPGYFEFLKGTDSSWFPLSQRNVQQISLILDTFKDENTWIQAEALQASQMHITCHPTIKSNHPHLTGTITVQDASPELHQVLWEESWLFLLIATMASSSLHFLQMIRHTRVRVETHWDDVAACC